MSLIRDEAAVLGRLDYSETSQVIVVLTRNHGKFRGIAKGIKRGTKTRFAVGIDLLDIGTIVATGRSQREGGLATVTEWRQTRSLSGLRERLCRIEAAQYAAEITGHLTEDYDPHPALYDTFLALLIRLADSPEPLPNLVRYQIELLEEVGSIPRFDACMACGRGTDLTHFSSFEGGMICRHCEPTQVEKREVTQRTWRTLRDEGSALLLQTDEATATEPATAAVAALRRSAIGPFSLLNYHVAHLMGREPLLSSKVVPMAERRRLR